MIQSFFNSWLVQNILTVTIALAVVIIACLLARREYWRVAAKEIWQRKAARVSFVILLLYAAIALLDSIGWRRPAMDAATGKPALHPATGKPIMDPGAPHWTTFSSRFPRRRRPPTRRRWPAVSSRR